MGAMFAEPSAGFIGLGRFPRLERVPVGAALISFDKAQKRASSLR